MILLFDTETTGASDPVRIVQAACLELSQDGTYSIGKVYDELFNPERSIECGAMEVHGILPGMVARSRSYTEFALPADTEYIIGHNIDYDWRVAGCPDVKRICTLALSRSLWPDADSHKLLALLYMLDPFEASRLRKLAHNALEDVRMNHTLLMYILRKIGGSVSIERLWELSEAARIPTVMAFGKHKGAKIADIPRDYVEWMLRQIDLDPYLKTALERRLGVAKPGFMVPDNTLPF